MAIYTGKGDEGSTQLFGGEGISKAAPRVEAYGTVDELNAVLGWARVGDLSGPLRDLLGRLQADCFRLGAWLAAEAGKDPGVKAIAPDDVAGLEAQIDRLAARLSKQTHFILPGGSEGAARLHVARTVARRAERAVVAFAAVGTVDASAVAWLNRVSDLLFTAARSANADAGVEDVPW